MIEEDLKLLEVSLSDYCLNRCKTVCCDLDVFVEPREAPFFKKAGVKLRPKYLPMIQNLFLIGYVKPPGPCPYYDRASRRCTEHDNPSRPLSCKTYPLDFDKDKKIVVIKDACGLTQVPRENFEKSSIQSQDIGSAPRP